MFHTIAIIGLGLIGSSLAYDIRSHKLAEKLIGIDSDPKAEKALSQVLDSFDTMPGESLREADFIILSVPPGKFGEMAKAIAPFLKEGALVTDTGSVKQYAIEAIAAHLPGYVFFVPSHPIAGSAKSGAKSGRAGLFLHRRVILTPYREDQEAPLKAIVEFWQAVGAQCEVMASIQHDLIYAHVSHMPQLVASAAMLTMAPHHPPSTPALKTFLRISGSNPALWRDIIMSNRKFVADALENTLQVVSQMRQELGEGIDQNAPHSLNPEGVTILFPRMVASALIHAVHFCERTLDVTLARYAGQGFRDTASIIQTPPEEDIEKISNSYGQLYELLMEFEKHLDQFVLAIKQEDWAALEKKLASAQRAHKEWVE